VLSRHRGRCANFLKERLAGLTPATKLVWFWIREFPGPYSKRSLAEALGVSEMTATRALKALIERGLLEVTEAPRGRIPGSYRALP